MIRGSKCSLFLNETFPFAGVLVLASIVFTRRFVMAGDSKHNHDLVHGNIDQGKHQKDCEITAHYMRARRMSAAVQIANRFLGRHFSYQKNVVVEHFHMFCKMSSCE